MSRREMLDLVVVGAGVVGSATALAAARDGLRVALVEAHEPPAWAPLDADLRVYAFAPDNAALLDDLGAWAAIRAARAHPYRRMRVWDAAGGGELDFDADALGRAHLGHIVEHSLLVDRLWAACGREASLRRVFPARLASLEQDPDSATAVLEDGQRLRAKLVVGADGAASRVRAAVGLDTEAHDYGQRGLVAYVGTGLAHQDTAWQRFLPTGPLAFLPCADGRCSIVWTLPADEATRMRALDEYEARVGDAVTVEGALHAFLDTDLDTYITGGKGWSNFPSEHQQRKIPWCNLTRNTQRLHLLPWKGFLQFIGPTSVIEKVIACQRNIDVSRLANRFAAV